MENALATGRNHKIGKFDLELKTETLALRLVRDGEGYLFEKDTVERDGTTLTLALPFNCVEGLYEFAMADPQSRYYKAELEKWIARICPDWKQCRDQVLVNGRYVCLKVGEAGC